MRLTRQALLEKMARIKADPLVLLRPETDTARIYHTHSRVVKEVRLQLIREKTSDGVRVQKIIREHKEHRSLTKSIAKAEMKYPGILKSLVRDGNCQVTADKFSMSRQNVHLLRQKIARYGKLEKMTFRRVVAQFSRNGND